jgi:Mg2+/Co2+ transporter CorC
MGTTLGSHPKPIQRGKIVGTLSANDFRAVKADILRYIIELTVEQFLKTMSGGDALRPPVICLVNSTLATFMADATASKVHRAWVTNEYGWLSRAVTFTDVISAVQRHHRKAILNA